MVECWVTTIATIITIVISWGRTEPFEFQGYRALADQFYREVQELWRKEDEERR